MLLLWLLPSFLSLTVLSHLLLQHELALGVLVNPSMCTFLSWSLVHRTAAQSSVVGLPGHICGCSERHLRSRGMWARAGEHWLHSGPWLGDRMRDRSLWMHAWEVSETVMSQGHHRLDIHLTHGSHCVPRNYCGSACRDEDPHPSWASVTFPSPRIPSSY